MTDIETMRMTCINMALEAARIQDRPTTAARVVDDAAKFEQFIQRGYINGDS